MKLLLVDNAHIFRTKDGTYYSSVIYGNEFFERYLQAFDSVRFVCKVKYIQDYDTESLIRITNSNIEICEIPWYQGEKQLFRILFKVIRAYKDVANGCDCAILRMTQIESIFAFCFSNCRRLAYAVEMVNDPKNNNYKFWIKAILLSQTKRIINHAIGISYVTKEYLQSRYSCKKIIERNGFTGYYSSVVIYEKDIANLPKPCPQNRTIHMIHISNAINTYEKGHKATIDVLNELLNGGIDVDLEFVGDGELVEEFKSYAESLGVTDKVNFCGRLAIHEDIMEHLKRADVFVFPTTFPEGLPRVVIEAMSVGLPCIASPAGGMSELLAREYIIPANDTEAYSSKIVELCHDMDKFKDASFHNICKAREYIKPELDFRRKKFYSCLRDSAAGVEKNDK